MRSDHAVNLNELESTPSLREKILQNSLEKDRTEIDAIWAGPKDKIVASLKEFLAKRWNSVKGTFLSYTSIPDSEISKTCYEIADYLAKAEDKPALSFLIPTIKHYENLFSSENINEVPLHQLIKVHITSDDGEALIPISIFSEMILASKVSDYFWNPYTNKKLTESEQQRIMHHSLVIEELLDLHKQYTNTSTGATNLYSQIHALIKGLNKGGAHGTAGGTEGLATEPAYEALDSFRKYWDALSEAQKSQALQFPKFKREMDLKIYNDKFSDCVEILAGDLDVLISADEVRKAFISIFLDEAKLAAILRDIETAYNITQKSLAEVLGNPEKPYAGRDHLYLSIDQITQTVKESQIKNVNDVLLMLKNLTATELKTVLGTFGNAIFNALDQDVRDDTFVFLALQSEQLNVFVESYVNHLLHLFASEDDSDKLSVPLTWVIYNTTILTQENARAFYKGLQKLSGQFTFDISEVEFNALSTDKLNSLFEYHKDAILASVKDDPARMIELLASSGLPLLNKNQLIIELNVFEYLIKHPTKTDGVTVEGLINLLKDFPDTRKNELLIQLKTFIKNIDKSDDDEILLKDFTHKKNEAEPRFNEAKSIPEEKTETKPVPEEDKVILASDPVTAPLSDISAAIQNCLKELANIRLNATNPLMISSIEFLEKKIEKHQASSDFSKLHSELNDGSREIFNYMSAKSGEQGFFKSTDSPVIKITDVLIRKIEDYQEAKQDKNISSIQKRS